jgi:phosphatidylglycerophosphate synthase
MRESFCAGGERRGNVVTNRNRPSMPARLWRPPGAPLRSRVLVSALLGCLATLGSSLLLQAWVGTNAAQPLAATALFATAMLVAAAAMNGHHPFPSFGRANQITLARAALTAIVASLIGEPRHTAVTWIIVGAAAAATALDGVDGWAARRARMASAFGARFDMEVDALLILALSVLVWRHHKAGVWVLGCGVMRYAFVVAGWWLPWLARPLSGTIRGKTVTVVQLAGLSAALAPVVPELWSARVAAIAFALLSWSFAVDVEFLWRTRGGDGT